MKTCLLKTGEKILELLEEVSQSFVRGKLRCIPYLTQSLGPSLQWSHEHSCCCSPTNFSMGWRMDCFLVP